MGHEASLITQFINNLFHTHLHDNVVMGVIAFLVSFIIFVILKKDPDIIPTPAQQFYEGVINSISTMLEDNIGKEGKEFLPFVTTLAIYIFISNALGLIPGFSAATGNLNTTAALAILVFFYYNYIGIKKHGFKYIKHFLGPVWWLAPLMLPIEIISHLARPFSLSIRLFANMFGDHSVFLVFLTLIPFVIPIPFLALGLFVCFIQTLIFVMLTVVYLAGAVAEEH
ncbi:F-type H+-transporting ATPase subunit a [Thermotomaculum hydrothermale]|uniref:ATP synthase subunit a n=1 Tax=Thermotomaculum hydrothermale TaxID=981385 RepID=A0A7R6PFD4_9BACT|nr:F0F1 ATP synthase subunit A [Thermotomaculum hydrothermale]BBB32719.1 F-type H+-transporting ATPase subunit a [Thermotomaculum hydrothermale]